MIQNALESLKLYPDDFSDDFEERNIYVVMNYCGMFKWTNACYNLVIKM